MIFYSIYYIEGIFSKRDSPFIRGFYKDNKPPTSLNSSPSRLLQEPISDEQRKSKEQQQQIERERTEREKREKDQREKEQREKERREKEQQEKERREKEEEEKKRQAKVGSKKEKSKQGKLPMPRAQGSQGSQASSLAVKVELVDVEQSSTAPPSRDIARDPRTRPSRHDPRLQREENSETLEALHEAPPVKVLVDPYLEHQPEENTTLSVEVLSQPKAVPKMAVAKRQRKAGAAPKKAIAKHPPMTPPPPTTPMTPMTPPPGLAPSQEKKLLEIKQLLQRETSGGPPSPPEAPTTPMTPSPPEVRLDFSTDFCWKDVGFLRNKTSLWENMPNIQDFNWERGG